MKDDSSAQVGEVYAIAPEVVPNTNKFDLFQLSIMLFWLGNPNWKNFPVFFIIGKLISFLEDELKVLQFLNSHTSIIVLDLFR